MFKHILIIIISCLFFFVACNGSSGDNSNSINNPDSQETDSDDDDTDIVSKSLVLYDANGKVGYALSAGSFGITMLSSNDYIYDIDWSGELTATSIFYSAVDCGETPYLSVNRTTHIKGKSVFYGAYLDKIYIPKTINSDGTAYFDNNSQIQYFSIDSGGTVYNYPSVSVYIYGVELEESDKDTAGIPEIIPPLSIEFE